MSAGRRRIADISRTWRIASALSASGTANAMHRTVETVWIDTDRWQRARSSAGVGVSGIPGQHPRQGAFPQENRHPPSRNPRDARSRKPSDQVDRRAFFIGLLDAAVSGGVFGICRGVGVVAERRRRSPGAELAHEPALQLGQPRRDLPRIAGRARRSPRAPCSGTARPGRVASSFARVARQRLSRSSAALGAAVHAAAAVDRACGAARAARCCPRSTAARISRPSRRRISSVTPLISARSVCLARLALGDLDQRAVAEHLEGRPVDLARARVAHQIELAQHRERRRVERLARP